MASPTTKSSSSKGAKDKNVFPTIDARFKRFNNFKQESSAFATLVYGHAGKPKVLKYDVSALIKRGAFRTAVSAKGTIFTMDRAVWQALVWYFFVALVSFVWAFFMSSISDAAKFDASKLESVSNYLNMFIPFMLSLYVSLALARWWALRQHGIGQVLDSAQNLVLVCVAILPGKEFQEFHDQVLKYALASVSLIVQTVRGKADVESLGPKRDSLLTTEEVAVLSDMPIRPRPVVMWAWILALITKVLEEQGVPPGKQRDAVVECVKARDGISLIWTYLGTQLPFAYVHLVTFLVNLNNLVMAIKCGVVFAACIENKSWIQAGSQLVFIFVVPLLYQGLLSVSYVIHDPFGEDLLDFPVMAFQEYTNEASASISHYTHKCPCLSKDWGLPPDDRQIALRKGAGLRAADALAEKNKEPPPPPPPQNTEGPSKNEEPGANDTDGAIDNTDGVVETPLLASLREQMRVKDELIASLQQQNTLLESNVSLVGSRVRTLELQAARLPVPPEPQGWCVAPAYGSDVIRETAAK